MNELEILESIRRRADRLKGSGVRLGIGDDCAIYRPRGSRENLLVTTDLLLEGVHFRRETHPAAALGHKALARGLSDIAAMGGTPRFCLVSLAAPDWAGRNWVDGFYRGLLRLARETATELAGGDLARNQRMVCDIVVCGAVAAGKALRRDGGRAGDVLYVSGALGGSALGLETKRGKAWQRHLRPLPRLELGRFLRGRLRATAAMDLSDGLSLDLHRLCLASGTAASIEEPLPVFPGANLDQALHGGEDYELLFAVRPGVKVPERWRGIPLTRIGRLVSGRPGHVEFFGRLLQALGWDHFRSGRV